MNRKYYILLLSVLLAACGHHHDHDAHAEEHEAAEEHTIGITIRTTEMEVYTDFHPLVTGHEAELAIHLTRLSDYKPVEISGVSATLLMGDEEVVASQAEPASTAGIYLASFISPPPGTYTLAFGIGGERANVSAEVVVYESEEQAEAASQMDDGELSEIQFLKDQSWRIDFAVEPAVRREIYDVVYSSGVWKTAPGATKAVVAPVSGVLDYRSKGLTEGGDVDKGQLLMAIGSDELTGENIGVEVEQARSVFEQAESEYQRKQELYKDRIVPRSDLEQAERAYKVAKSNYESLTRGYSSGQKTITAPFSGYIKTVHVSNGDFVEEGTKLITLASERSRILESHVSPTYAVTKDAIRNIWYQPRPEVWSSLEEAGGTVLSVGEQVSSDHPMAAVFAQVNEDVSMPAGGFSEVQIALGEPHSGIVVPESALLEDYGNFSVIVQLTGETFERRPVAIGRRNGESVEVVSGLEEGEWVVTTGAYQVRMAAMSVMPDHGHSH